MNAAVRPRDPARATRLLHLDPASGRWWDHRIDALPRLLEPGDLLVVNDAATLPGSLTGRDDREP